MKIGDFEAAHGRPSDRDEAPSKYLWDLEGETLQLYALEDRGTFDDGRAYMIVWVRNFSQDGDSCKLMLNKEFPLRQVEAYLATQKDPARWADPLYCRPAKVKPGQGRYARWELIDPDPAMLPEEPHTLRVVEA